MEEKQKYDANEAKRYIQEQIDVQADVAIVLGSGLSAFVDDLEILWQADYEEIPSFPASTVAGHKGTLFFAKIGDFVAVLFQGRFHYYEGHPIEATVFPVSLCIALGIPRIVLTNAAGSLDEKIPVGSIMLIEDHLSFFVASPLRGPNDDAIGPRFPDMTNVYSQELQGLARATAKELEIPLHSGIYAYMKGPQYETPAEIRALRVLGASAVGMSTVSEAIAAKHASIEVLAFSTITNQAAGLGEERLQHEDVLHRGKEAASALARLLTTIIERLAD